MNAKPGFIALMRRLRRVPSAVLILAALAAPAWPAANEVLIIRVSDAISPATADFIHQGIKSAAKAQAALVVIELDTPGGLADSMRTIVQDILASTVPVAVFVAPSGARAASAGVMITMAADIAAMAPGTNIGAAHPVGAGGQEIDGKMSEKVVNDMVAQAKSVAERRGRSAQWVERAIRESISATESEALAEGVIDLVAADIDDLLRQVNGRQIPGKGALTLDSPRKTVVEETLRTKILKTISNPNIAYILLMIGLAGLYFEFSHPGAIFPGVVGGICLILAFFAMQTLPVNYAGILLIVLAIIFFIMEMKIASYGLLSVAGLVALLLGSLMLFSGGEPESRVAWSVFVPTLLTVGGFFVSVAFLVMRAQASRTTTGSSGMLGQIALAKTPLAPQGKVAVHGEIWNAVSAVPVAAGASVRIVKATGLLLEVEPLAAGPGKA
ncbi:MAG: nodulation protein NfeD [Desulfobacterales bacterium]|nr:nodulation protein NfeD [Desulfobacterales bacterium]